MTRARFFYPEVRLKRLLAEPGGIRVDEAIKRAEERIESVRGTCLLAIDEKIAAIAGYDEGAAEVGRRCYVLANEIYAEAGLLGLSELSDVAHNLCEIISMSSDGRLPKRAVRVHVDAMKALRSPAASENLSLRIAVLSELHRLTSSLAHHS